MSLVMINEAVAVLKESGVNFTDKESQFVLIYALKTEDIDRVKELIRELAQSDEAGREEVMSKYQQQCDEKPGWIKDIEELLVSLEVYRIEEDKAIKRLSEVLSAYGIDISENDIKALDTDELKDRVKDETKEKIREE